MTLWLVRAGRAGEKEHVALQNKAAVIGWEELPDLSTCADREDLLTLLRLAYPTERRKTLASWQNQIWPIRDTMQVGDLVALPLKSRPSIAFGTVAGGYSYRSDLPGGAQHTRPVDWHAQVPRSEFDSDMLFSFGAFMTVCRIARNDAEPRIRALLDQEKWPAADAMRPTPPPTMSNLRPALDPPVPLSIATLEERSASLIRDRIAQRFKGHSLAGLIGTLLELKGLCVRVSPPGIDGGVDILAGGGPLGRGGGPAAGPGGGGALRGGGRAARARCAAVGGAGEVRRCQGGRADPARVLRRDGAVPRRPGPARRLGRLQRGGPGGGGSRSLPDAAVVGRGRGARRRGRV